MFAAHLWRICWRESRDRKGLEVSVSDAAAAPVQEKKENGRLSRGGGRGGSQGLRKESAGGGLELPGMDWNGLFCSVPARL